MKYIDTKYTPSKTDLVCDFYVQPSGKTGIRKAAEHVAAESSVGTWTDLMTEKKYMKKLAAKVFSIKGNRVRTAYPLDLFEFGNIPQILSSIAGNIFGMKSVRGLRLEDIEIPEKLVKSFPGPRFGIQGVRRILKVKSRPLLGTIVKPKLGLKTSDHAKVAYSAWLGGCDLVKDDENLSSQRFNPFKKRVLETLKARDKAEKETGERKVYLPNVTAEAKEMLERAKFVKDAGGEYVMIDLITAGFSAAQSLRDLNLGVVIHAHRAMHAALTRNPKHGISMLVISKFARLLGVDQIHIGTVVGKMEGSRKEIAEIKNFLVSEFFGLKPVFPVCSGGLHPGLVPKLVKLLGKDIIIQMGGGIHGHPRGTIAGAKAARQALEATTQGISLRSYAKAHSELREALRKWG
ncbi:MAG: type III ribulose-bisphosphate carboxylase [Candidatus Aenigmatarchaeota archaeon]|nr:MAG: type III ribulose-bisphosphate carboxylase [Candidatus Aenigmarchaeota archaeon]